MSDEARCLPTQATPAIPGDEGPTDCVNCGRRIRRFGQTRRWCHDETGDVQCSTAPGEPGVSDHIGPELVAEVARRAERHPYADHPVSLAIHDHIAAIGTRAPTSRAACECGWRGAVCDYPAHLAETLDQAGLLKPAAPAPMSSGDAPDGGAEPRESQ